MLVIVWGVGVEGGGGRRIVASIASNFLICELNRGGGTKTPEIMRTSYTIVFVVEFHLDW